MRILNSWVYSIALASVLECLSFAQGTAQGLNTNWREDLNASMADFKACQSKSNGTDCAQYTAAALQTVYRVNDFYSSEKKRYLTPAEIADYLNTTKSWGLIGHSYEQAALSDAQDRANAKKAVVAVYMNEDGIGHIALITPGTLQPSGSWGLRVPNTASFLVSEPEKSFVDKGLSFAFTKNLMKDVLIYGRNY